MACYFLLVSNSEFVFDKINDMILFAPLIKEE